MTYNGHGLNEFVPQRTAAYISQHDVHIGEMTVRETLAFSARCQGVGSRYGESIYNESCFFDIQNFLKTHVNNVLHVFLGSFACQKSNFHLQPYYCFQNLNAMWLKLDLLLFL